MWPGSYRRWTSPTSWSKGSSWPNWCWTTILPEQGLSHSSLSRMMHSGLNESGEQSNSFLRVKTTSVPLSPCLLYVTLCFPPCFHTQMVAGNQVNNLRNKHSSTDGQGWPTQGGDGRGHEQSGALQGDQHEYTVELIWKLLLYYSHITEVI